MRENLVTSSPWYRKWLWVNAIFVGVFILSGCGLLLFFNYLSGDTFQLGMISCLSITYFGIGLWVFLRSMERITIFSAIVLSVICIIVPYMVCYKEYLAFPNLFGAVLLGITFFPVILISGILGATFHEIRSRWVRV